MLVNLPGIKAINSLGLHSPNPPVGLAYIAAVLRKNGYAYKVIDMAGEALNQIASFKKKKSCYIQGLSIEQCLSRIPENTDIIGVSCMFSPHWPILRDLTDKIRIQFPNIFMVAGGEHVTALPEFSLQNSKLDAIILGEGELIFPSLIKAFRNNEDFQHIKGLAFKDRTTGKMVVNMNEQRIADLDSIPWPDWDNFPIEKYIESDFQNGVNRGRSMPIVATRGCPHRCSFCSNMKMWAGIYKVRNPADVVSEMENYMKKWEIVNFNFQDLTAFLSKQWILKLSGEIVSRGLHISWQLPSGIRAENFDNEVALSVYKAGCKNMAFAPESASSEILASVKKDVDLEQIEKAIKVAVANDINLSCFLVIGFPLETIETLRMALKFVKKLAYLGVSDIGLAQFVPYPGSELFDQLLKSGQIKLDDEFFLSPMEFYLKTSRCYAKNLTSKQLYDWQIKILVNFYLLSFFCRPLKTFRNIIKALLFRKEETRYAKFITDIIYRRTNILIKSKTNALLQKKPGLGRRTVSIEPADLHYLPDEHYESAAKLETSYWWHISRLNWTQRLIKSINIDTSTLNILDYGCGTGGFLYGLNKKLRFKSCLGVDTSDKAIQFARRYGNYFTKLKPGDFRVPDDVNLIFLMDVLEHIENDELLLKSLVGSLKRKTYVLISVPALPCLYSNWDHALGHYRRYTKKSLEELVNKAGGKVKNMKYCFSYSVPIILLKRVILKTSYDEQNCEFPPVPKYINWFLLLLNRLEMFGAKYINYPAGSSLFCLFEK